MGGKIFVDHNGVSLTRHINKDEYLSTMEFLDSLSLPGIEGVVGSALHLENDMTVGDIDILFLNYLISELEEKLKEWIHLNHPGGRTFLKTTKTMIHFCCPIAGNPELGYVQVDFFASDNPDWELCSKDGCPSTSKYKGVHRTILLASIAKDMGMKYSPTRGLIDRATDKVLTANHRKAVMWLIGLSLPHTPTVEEIIEAIKSMPRYENMVKDARQTFHDYGVKFPGDDLEVL